MDVFFSEHTVVLTRRYFTQVAVAYVSLQIAWKNQTRTRQQTDLMMTKKSHTGFHGRWVAEDGHQSHHGGCASVVFASVSGGDVSHWRRVETAPQSCIADTDTDGGKQTDGPGRIDRRTRRQAGSDRTATTACRKDDPQAALPRHRSRSK